MIHLSKQLLQSCFFNLGYSPLDYLYLDEIQKALNQLNQEQFDKQTFQQIHSQCKNNSRGQIKLDDIMQTFIKAQNILVQREQQLKSFIFFKKETISKSQHEIKDLYRSAQGSNQITLQQQKLQDELAELKQQLVNNAINLEIIRKPFTNKKFTQSIKNRSPQKFQATVLEQQQEHEFPMQGIMLASNTQTFTWIFELTAILLLVQLPCLLYTNNFMNILLFSIILLNLITGYFCRTIIRIWMYLLIACIIVDVVWYIIGARTIWSSNYHDWTRQLRPYLKLTIALYTVIALGKLILIALFLSEYNTDETQKKRISVFGFCELQLSHDQITKNVFHMLNKTSHPFQAQLHA